MWSRRAATTTYWCLQFTRQQVYGKNCVNFSTFLACRKLAGSPPREKSPRGGSLRDFSLERASTGTLPGARKCRRGRPGDGDPGVSDYRIHGGEPPAGRPGVAADRPLHSPGLGRGWLQRAPPVSRGHPSPAGGRKKGSGVAAAARGRPVISGPLRIPALRQPAPASGTGR